uniref:Uncharacterized protein n=1 Tax=Percolomonas cosmopolitus TaxID=63605 RepID=A0A7S1PHM7_9EUKA
MTSTLLSLLLLSVLIASISATTTIRVERTNNHTIPIAGKRIIGNILIDGQSYGKTMEVGHLALYPNTPNNPFYSVEKVFIYELKSPCTSFDCARAGFNSHADEVFIVPYDSSDQKHIRVGSSVQYLLGTPVGMSSPTQTFNSIMAKLGTDLDNNNVQLEIIENY